MKQVKVNRYSKVDFSPLLPLMLAVHKKEVPLMAAFLKMWNVQEDKSAPLEFREVFTAFALEQGYCDKWAGAVARDADRDLFGLRGKRSDIGKAKDKTKKKTNDKPTKKKVTPEQLAHMAKSLDTKGLKTLITLLVAM